MCLYKMKGIRHIYAKCHQGQLNRGVEKAYKHIACRFDFDRSGHHLQTNKFNSRKGFQELNDHVYESQLDGEVAFVVGGDHSISIGSVAGSLKHHKDNLSVVWIDAHADINTSESSPSGNQHGMPIACLTGIEDYFPKSQPLLDPDNIVYLGLRDVDDFESDVIAEKNIKFMSSHELNRDCDLDWLKINTDNIHLSIDVDVLDPELMASTGTPVEEGITMEKLEELVDWTFDQGKVVSLDLVEFNPKLGTNKEKATSLKNYYKIIDMLHGKLKFPNPN